MTIPNAIDSLDARTMQVRLKLAAAWTSFVFFYAYVDILGFYRPGLIEQILDDKVFTFDITETWAVTVLALLAVPISMVVASAALPARACRIVNLVVVVLYLPFTAFNAFGDVWTVFVGLGVALEVVLLGLIARWTWTWPRRASAPAGPR